MSRVIFRNANLLVSNTSCWKISKAFLCKTNCLKNPPPVFTPASLGVRWPCFQAPDLSHLFLCLLIVAPCLALTHLLALGGHFLQALSLITVRCCCPIADSGATQSPLSLLNQLFKHTAALPTILCSSTRLELLFCSLFPSVYTRGWHCIPKWCRTWPSCAIGRLVFRVQDKPVCIESKS